MRRRKKNKSFLGRKLFVILCVVCVLGLTIVGTIAYLQKNSSLVNTFEKGNTEIEVKETFNEEKTEKTNVYLKNEGNTSVYVRAKVLIYYEDAEGNVLDLVPTEGTDYEKVQGSDDWIESEGIYYYKFPVGPSSENGQTTSLISKIKDLKPDDDKYLVVNILGQSVQAAPVSAVESIWNVTVDENGNITGIN